MNHHVRLWALIECAFLGLVYTALAIYFIEIFTAEKSLLTPPSFIGVIADLLLYAVLTLPGAYALTKIFPSGKRSQRILLFLVSMALPTLALLLTFVSHVVWKKTGTMLSMDLLLYGAAHFGSMEKLGTSDMLYDAIKLVFLVVAFFGLALKLHLAKPRWRLILLAIPLTAGLLSLAAYAKPPANSKAPGGWYAEGHLSSLLVAQWFKPASLESEEGSKDLGTLYQPPVITDLKQRPNIIMIVLESTRADALGPRADGRPSLTPFLDELAQTSLRASRAYTTTDHTSKALVGILCGAYPNPKFAIIESNDGGMKPECLAKLLTGQGYASLFLQTPPSFFEQRTNLAKNMGYQLHLGQQDLDPRYANLSFLSTDDRAIIDPAISWVKQQQQPYLLTLLTSVTHYPYSTPSPGASADRPAPPPESAPEVTRKNYEAAVRYSDDVMRELFGQLRQAGALENSIVIITADHGEAFGEHGAYTHNGIPFAEVMQVPLLIHYPARYPQGGDIRGLRQHIDIVPTVLDLLGADWQGKLPGTSLISSPGHDMVISNCWGAKRCLTLSEDEEALTYFYNDRPAQRFDLAKDPQQKAPLALPNTEHAQRQMRYIVARTKAIDHYWDSK